MTEPERSLGGTSDAANSQAARTVHVDTSLIIEQQKVKEAAEPVRQLLSAYGFTSASSYSKKEFKRSLLQDLALLHKKARDCDRVDQVQSAIRKSLWKPESKRRLTRCLEAIEKFLSIQPDDLPVAALMARFRTHVSEAVLCGFLTFDATVTYVFDGTGCIRASEAPTRTADGRLDVAVRDCQRNHIRCNVHNFFTDNKPAFSKIRNAINDVGQSASAELKRTAKTIEIAATDPQALCDNKNCTAMSDALIAVDGIKMDHFAANNPAEWKVIANALDKPLVNPVAAPSADKSKPE